jgi:hypothetical protein
MSDTIHREFLGDSIRDFRLTPPMIIELERICHGGIGGIVRRVFARDFTFAEVTETIRLGLIGGGTDPEEAAALIAAHVTPRPLMIGFALATAILQATMLGVEKVKPGAKSRKRNTA